MRVLLAGHLDDEDRDRLVAAFPALDFSEPDAAESAAGYEVVFGWPSAEMLASDGLRWVQVRSAGVNSMPLDNLARRGIRLTTGSGAHGTPIAENMLAMMLAFAIRLPDLVRLQTDRRWDRHPIDDSKFELEGQTLLIAGLGGIGATLARKAKGLGLQVMGYRRHALPPPPGVDEMVSPVGFQQALGRADHVALCLPLTPDTEGFIGEAQLRAMKPTAYLYNAGRGKCVERGALLRALDEGWIAGAGLDVTDPEPLPQDDALWAHPNVILSQHTSGASRHNSRRVTDIFIQNLRRYLAGEPLVNEVDLQAGY